MSSDSSNKKRGPIAWMARNNVAANLIFLILIVGGLISSHRIKQEVFPEFSLDIISVMVPYPGASPQEVEQGILLAAEEAVSGITGIKKIRSTAKENLGYLIIELLIDAEPNKVVADVKAAIDRIRSFPENAERPEVTLLESKKEVISMVLYGDFNLKTLRYYAELSRESLLQEKDITYVELGGVLAREISINVPRDNLEK